MFTYKFYVKMSKNNTLMFRITNNRKKAELALGFRISEEELTDIPVSYTHLTLPTT